MTEPCRRERVYRDAQRHDLPAGWWSLISLLVMNWVALVCDPSAVGQVQPAGYPAAVR
jgi:hypothetical protein